MPGLKRLKKLPKLDMNPMVDMAFLLVSFFMMTTTFKTDTPVDVVMPSAHVDLKVPSTDVCLVTIGDDERVFIGIDNKFDRKRMLEVVGKQNNQTFSEAEKGRFSLLSSTGMPIKEISRMLKLPREEQKQVVQPGIPMTEENNEFRQWIIAARLANPRLRFAIHADEGVSFPVVELCFNTLQDLNITRFNLITEAKKDDPGTRRH